jgi:hypothetical protein
VAKKKPAAKKKAATKKAKKQKKKVVKKAKKPAKAVKPKVINFPSPRAISGYTVFIKDVMGKKSGNAISMAEASTLWKALSDTEKEVFPIIKPRPHGTRRITWMLTVDLEISRTGRKCYSQRAIQPSPRQTITVRYQRGEPQEAYSRQEIRQEHGCRKEETHQRSQCSEETNDCLLALCDRAFH